MPEMNYFIVSKRIDDDDPKGGIRCEMAAGTSLDGARDVFSRELASFATRGFELAYYEETGVFRLFKANHPNGPATVEVWLEGRQPEVMH